MRPFYTINPKLKKFIFFISSIFLITGLFQSLIPFLGLSLLVFQQKFIWQLLFYPFIHPPFFQLSFHTIFPFALQIYLLWMFGNEIVERKGLRSFFTLYLGSSVFSGTISLCMMLLFKHFTILTGLSAVSYALMIAWVMLNPFSQLLLFFSLPFKAYQLIFGTLIIHLFIEYANGHFINAMNSLGAALFSYFFALVAWNTYSPFTKLQAFERKIIYFAKKMQFFFQNAYGKIFKKKIRS